MFNGSSSLYRIPSIFSTSLRLKQFTTIGRNLSGEPSIKTSTSQSEIRDIVPRIGLEVHAQLKLNSKLFSQGTFSYEERPNSHLDLLDIAVPGSLPKLNLVAIQASALTALGLNCTVQDDIHFDRKNYFYSDMPAGYQITQYNKPIAKDGYIDFVVTAHHKSLIAHSQNYDLVRQLYWTDRFKDDGLEPYVKRSKIKQIQVEQDSAKTLTLDDNKMIKDQLCLIDYNRSGCALIEIVFEPDLTSHHEASSVVKELIRILKSLNTCDCELEHGSLRVDANVSIKSVGGNLIEQSSRVELKNLNSLKSLNRGILHEIKRQANLISEGREVLQESRTYITQRDKTEPMRLKEDAVDYRYVPEPSIPPLVLDDKFISHMKTKVPNNLPQATRSKLLKEYKLDLFLIDELLDEPGLDEYFVNIAQSRDLVDFNVIADFLIYTVANLKKLEHSSVLVDLKKGSDFLKILPYNTMQCIIDMALDDEISFTTALEVSKHLYLNMDKSNPRKLVEELGWYKISDNAEIAEICREPIALMKNISKQYRKKGDKKYLRMILEKVCESSNNRISVPHAIRFIDSVLKPPK